jgi:antitoxin (DNA-binding transcriptional repressor) of toxin-antitoxin stability system
MHQQELNISSVQKNLPKLMDLIVHGSEIIITDSNIPIAKISPIEEKKVTYSSSFLKARSVDTKRSPFLDSPENWFG